MTTASTRGDLPSPRSLWDTPTQGHALYDPRAEHDACGVAFVATLTKQATHEIVQQGLTALINLDHRGAVGAEVDTGDGAGILTQIPDEFFQSIIEGLPAHGEYAAGTGFLSEDPVQRAAQMKNIASIANDEELHIISWRDVPVAADIVGNMARETMPFFAQVFVESITGNVSGLELERRAYRLRKRCEHELGVFFASLSSRTITYKGMLTVEQLKPFFPDLSDPLYASRLALVHSRFSTNTFPSWPLAQPFRLLAHNGEINTVRGNRNWMAARQGKLRSPLLGNMADLLPVCTPGASDSASFDEVLELLHLGGRSLPHAVMMMIPEAWENHGHMDPERRAFYEYHANLIEPWDGPACLNFTDGTLIGAVLDRNGLRPGRYWTTRDGLVVMASEAGVLDIDESRIESKGRLEPGRMFLVDTEEGRIISDDEVKSQFAASHPYAQWVEENSIRLAELPQREHVTHSSASVERRQRAFGYTHEELKILLTPMSESGAEPLGAMGSDTPIAVLSSRPRLLFDYFTQMFAQVTNPPLDSIREQLVTSIGGAIGPEPNLLATTPDHARKLVLDFPVLSNDELAKIIHIDKASDKRSTFSSMTVRGLYKVTEGGEGLRNRLEEIFREVDEAVADGVSFIVLSDRNSYSEYAPIPSLLLLSAVHQHLLRQETRTQVSLIVEAGDVREVHHVALLIGYGAAAVNPYLAMETVEELSRKSMIGVDGETAVKNLIKALGKGVLKVMSKMGISTLSSYRGAQVFEALGLDRELVDEYFTGTTSRLGGIGLDVIAQEVSERHHDAYPLSGQIQPHRSLRVGGEYQWRRDGEEHLFDPETVFRLQHATRAKRYDVFRQYTSKVDEQTKRLMTLRGMLEFAPHRSAISIDEVEPVSEIVKRFNTGAMSYGSISEETHETLAIAMNQLGGRSNTGEGGERPERLYDPARRSRVKQIASGRFGVTSEYLVNADDIQIKLAQGAKPGEGGQLPGNKVYPWIAETRHSTPGVGLISPPPHHDIYSIEDLAQLIHDAKNANPRARVHVKLVSEFGVGTVAAGVSKAHADVVLISGHDGGTGASPLTSLKHAGTPWEIGLAETHQTLVLNDLRDRITVQVDGQLKTGRDVVIAALLGAEEFGFATAPMVVSGCIMMRVCHLDTCPVGVATQNPELRSRFTGKPEFVVNFFEFIAEEVREYLAQLGFRSIDEAIGHIEALRVNDAVEHWKADGLDLGPVLAPAIPRTGSDIKKRIDQDHSLDKALDNALIAEAAHALETGEPVTITSEIRNVNRTVGTMLGYEVTRRYRGAGLPDDTISVNFTGTAGQSFGAFLPRGITLKITGDANDYVAKGLSGGKIIVSRSPQAQFEAGANVIAGNVIGYGATSGTVLLNGVTGERFAVRNSGATFVVEGIGDHGLEYMTGGEVLVLGPTGRNLGAGMSGGVAYVLDLDPSRLNPDSYAAGDIKLYGLSDEDQERVTALLTLHNEATHSHIAAALLADIPAALARFTKVIPAEYERMRAAIAVAEQQGLDFSQPGVWDNLLEVTRG
ncbi:glutamate synthase large subunit [Jonesia quinghaiensis]|uniref:glutamate synthase large subunit n=1 Tax=Jonesia quinghaiensis TaxID=262806 RepID=UPI0004121983|nr:glutamate synthase large subunit [Jonesia quinghaiensis]